MPGLTAEGRSKAAEVAARHGVSASTAETLLMALAISGGGQAQFSIQELGGMGQWSRGGMVMVGDMFNNSLKARVDALCSELSSLVGSGDLVERGAAGGNWWPAELGTPSSAGSQNDMRYAFFPAARRLAISDGGRVTVYDTGDHQIGGFGQQQGNDRSLSFTSQYGYVRLTDLPQVNDGAGAAPQAFASMPPAASAAREQDTIQAPEPSAAAQGQPETRATQDPVQTARPDGMPAAPARTASSGASDDDIFGKLERLADLRAKGILSDEEFSSKKAELLGRL